MFQPDKPADLIAKPVEAKPFTLESLIAWLETKKGDEEYSVYDTDGGACGCLFAQYAVHRGYDANFDGYVALLKGAGTFPSDPVECVSCNEPYTFGAALLRARAYQAKVVV